MLLNQEGVMRYLILVVSLSLLGAVLGVGTEPKIAKNSSYWDELRSSNVVKRVQSCDLGKGFTASNSYFSFSYNKPKKYWGGSTLNTFESNVVVQKDPLLIWSRCAEGAVSIVRCDSAKQYSTDEIASILKQKNNQTKNLHLRVPTSQELLGIVEHSCEYPAINSENYWSFDAKTNTFNMVNFANGKLVKPSSEDKAYLRLVSSFTNQLKKDFVFDAVSPSDFHRGQ
jgi:hypothetical protein